MRQSTAKDHSPQLVASRTWRNSQDRATIRGAIQSLVARFRVGKLSLRRL